MNEIKRLQKLAGINEIKVNRPKRVWDFTKYIPNFTGKDMQIGDKLIIPVDPKWNHGIDITTSSIKNIDTNEDDYNYVFYDDVGSIWSLEYFKEKNNKNK